jgi:hypothetical protein
MFPRENFKTGRKDDLRKSVLWINVINVITFVIIFIYLVACVYDDWLDAG